MKHKHAVKYEKKDQLQTRKKTTEKKMIKLKTYPIFFIMFSVF